MKKAIAVLVLIILQILALTACGGTANEINSNEKMTVTINGVAFEAAIYDNETARAFLNLLPQTFAMGELNGNEKYVYLPNSLPSNADRIGRIEAGDIMLYGDNCIVLFYESFNTSYRYTRIGKLTDAEGLAQAAGTSSATVVFGITV